MVLSRIKRVIAHVDDTMSTKRFAGGAPTQSGLESRAAMTGPVTGSASGSRSTANSRASTASEWLASVHVGPTSQLSASTSSTSSSSSSSSSAIASSSSLSTSLTSSISSSSSSGNSARDAPLAQDAHNDEFLAEESAAQPPELFDEGGDSNSTAATGGKPFSFPPLVFSHMEWQNVFLADLAKVIGQPKASAWLQRMQVQQPVSEAVIQQHLRSILSDKTFVGLARRQGVVIPQLSPYLLTSSLFPLAERLLRSGLAKANFKSYLLSDQQLPAVSPRSITSNWGTSDGDALNLVPPSSDTVTFEQLEAGYADYINKYKVVRGASLARFASATTSFCHAAALTPALTIGLDVRDLQYFIFPKSKSGSKPQRTMLPSSVQGTIDLLEALRRLLQVMVYSASLELCLSKESMSDIIQGLTLLSTIDRSFFFETRKVAYQSSSFTYTVCRFQQSVSVVLHGVAPCSFCWEHTGNTTRRHQDVTIGIYRSLLPSNSFTTTAFNVNVSREYPILYKFARARNFQIPKWRNDAYELLRIDTSMTDVELARRNLPLAQIIGSFLARPASKLDLQRLHVKTGTLLQTVTQLLEARARRASQDVVDINTWRLSAPVDSTPSRAVHESIQRLIARTWQGVTRGDLSDVDFALRMVAALQVENSTELRVLFQQREAEWKAAKRFTDLSSGSRADLALYQSRSIHRIDQNISGKELLNAVVTDGAKRVYCYNYDKGRDQDRVREQHGEYRDRKRQKTDVCHMPKLIVETNGRTYNPTVLKASMHPTDTCDTTTETVWAWNNVPGGPVCNACYQHYQRLFKKQKLGLTSDIVKAELLRRYQARVADQGTNTEES